MYIYSESINSHASRSEYKLSQCALITVWFPKDLIPKVDTAVRSLDTDRSKFIPAAVREKMIRLGFKPKTKEAA